MTEPRPTIRRLRERKRQHQKRSIAYRIAFGAAGVIVVIGGLLLSLPGIPGPGIVLIALGLGMLALEFDRAERLLERVLDRFDRITEGASPVQKGVLAFVTIVGIVFAFVAVLIWEIPVLPG